MLEKRTTTLLAWSFLLACAPLPGDVGAPSNADARPSAFLVTTERRRQGSVLVRITESGQRVSELTRTQSGVGDRQPTISPDGKWVAFASNRGRASFEESSLWLVSASGEGEPKAITTGSGIDRDPTWDPSGTSIVFSSSRDGTFDLYRLPLADERPGAALRLSETEEHALAPAVSSDGRWIAYMLVSATGESTLWTVSFDGGTPRQLTRGPADVTPTFSRNSKRVYFAGRVPGRDDSDIFQIDLSGNGRAVLVSEPMSDQSGPRVSADGDWLFATSVYRSAGSGKPVLSSIVASELAGTNSKRLWRALHDPAYVESRVGIAVHGKAMLAKELRANPEYEPALRRAIEKILGEVPREQ